MKTGIYAIINRAWYIGQSQDVERRWEQERAQLKRGTFHNRHLQNSWSKHGEAVFDFRLLFECGVDRLGICEQAVFDLLQACGIGCYNEGPFLPAARRGKTHTQEARSKLREKAKAQMASPESRARIAEANRKRVWSPQSRAKVGKAAAGNQHSVGFHRSPEHLDRLNEGYKLWRLSLPQS
jgi:group I intron endonuclease